MYIIKRCTTQTWIKETDASFLSVFENKKCQESLHEIIHNDMHRCFLGVLFFPHQNISDYSLIARATYVVAYICTKQTKAANHVQP